MKTLWASIVCSLVQIPSAQGQEPVAESSVSVRASLQPHGPVARESDPLALTLEVRFEAATTADRTLLAGRRLVVRQDGEIVHRVDERLRGDVRVAAGTSIRRELSLEPGWLGERSIPVSGLRLDVEWPDLEGARCRVVVVANQSGLDVGALDLTRSKVRLITNYGDMVVTFRPDKAPKHVANFVKLAKDGFYNGTRFHRVIAGFMIQGGCPNTKAGAVDPPGTGNPGYTVEHEFSDLKHVRGVLSMARGPSVDSAGCQFFVMHGDAPGLDGKYSIFGQLESGLETLDKIADVRVRPTPRGEPSIPVEPVHLHAAVVEPVFTD